MTAKEWEEKFSEVTSNKLHHFTKLKNGYQAYYSFGKYGDRAIIFDSEEFIQKFYNNYSGLMKRTHALNFIFKAEPKYFDEIQKFTTELLLQKRFDELCEYMKSYVPKTRVDDCYGKHLTWFIATSYCVQGYAFRCDQFNEVVEEIGNRGMLYTSSELSMMQTPTRHKYCYAKTDFSDCMYPEVRLVGDIACVVGWCIDAWLSEKFSEFINDDPFYKYNVNDKRRDPSIERLEQRMEAAIRKFVKDIPIDMLAMKEAGII